MTMRDIADEDKVSLRHALDGIDMPAIADEARELVKASEFTKADGVPVPRPGDIDTPEKAQYWAEQEIIKATPRAVQEVIHQMRSGGDKKARLTAALQILDRAGVQAKANSTVVAPVFVLTADTVKNLPWLQAAKEKATKDKAIDQAREIAGERVK